MNRSELPSSVNAMLTAPEAPTAPLEDFLPAYEADDNLWWMLGCGHHQNLFEAAVDLAHAHTNERES